MPDIDDLVSVTLPFSGDIPARDDVEIATLDAEAILAREANGLH